TAVAPIAKVPFARVGYGRPMLLSGALERLGFALSEGTRLVFVNGRYSRELSSLGSLPGGARVGSLAAALAADRELIEPHLARFARYQDHAFVALNTAFIEDGAFLYVPAGKVVVDPIHLLFISTARGTATASHPRNLIVAGNNSQVTIVETYVGSDKAVYFTNAVTEIVVGENAALDHYKLQRESEEAFHVATLQVHQARSSTCASHSIAVGGGLVRNDVNVVLDGEGSECTLNGLYMVAGQQHVDNHTRIDHAGPHCVSRQLYKGVLGGKARGVFDGKIVVHPAAPKTDARQTNKNLLLSSDALIDTKPQLEINNNDVKCIHGSTIGRLDENSIFYLRSRGIGVEMARDILTYAFASEIINGIKVEPLRAKLDNLVATRLQNGLPMEATP
ncbi:MAG: Fe-S cluster assembly protein SufD, partial [Candidatus Rokubacteria bacterium]|nr:Fe-S cluster assembly protein SufD [Candidatus Rokubacteria bacterium]